MLLYWPNPTQLADGMGLAAHAGDAYAAAHARDGQDQDVVRVRHRLEIGDERMFSYPAAWSGAFALAQLPDGLRAEQMDYYYTA